MPIPWLRAIGLAIGLVRMARRRKFAATEEEKRAQGIELERERLDAERRRAEHAAQMEAIRQAGDRELGRLRLLTAIAVASWIGTLLAAVRLASGAVGARVAMGGAWMLLLAAIVLSFAAQGRVTDLLARSAEGESVTPTPMRSGLGQIAMAFLVAGLAMAGLAILV